MIITPQVIPVKNSNQRLDKFCAEYLNVPRAKITNLVQQQLVLVNQMVAAKPGLFLKAGDVIEITAPVDDLAKPWLFTPHEMPIKVVFEDEYLIIVHKPAGLLTLPTQHQETDTLLNGLIFYAQQKWMPLVVHRLDKETSGLIVFAKTETTQQKLLTMFEKRTIVKKYYALVHHNLERHHLMINVPIGRANDQSLKMIAGDAKNAKPASTEIEVLKQWAKYSLLDIILHTGRTHQIRVHLKYINHPIVNDLLYSNLPPVNADSQLLMAYYLAFIHPITHQQVCCQLELEPRFTKLMDSF